MARKRKPEHARVFLGLVPTEGEAAWTKLCRETVESIDGLSWTRARRHVYNAGEVDALIHATRSDEIVVVSQLSALDDRPLPDGLSVGEAFWLRLMDLRGACLYIVDAENGITSRDGAAWTAHAKRTYRSVTKGRTLTPEKARVMAIKSKKKRRAKPGSVAEFKSRARTEDRKRVTMLWTSRAFANAGEALETIYVDFPELNGASRSTIERITGVGRNGRPSKHR